MGWTSGAKTVLSLHYHWQSVNQLQHRSSPLPSLSPSSSSASSSPSAWPWPSPPLSYDHVLLSIQYIDDLKLFFMVLYCIFAIVLKIIKMHFLSEYYHDMQELLVNLFLLSKGNVTLGTPCISRFNAFITRASFIVIFSFCLFLIELFIW